MQLAPCPIESDALHVTVVVPTSNDVPDSGVQVIVTGARPPLTVGAPYDTATACPSIDCVTMFGGHESESAWTFSEGIGEGAVGGITDESSQVVSQASAHTQTTSRLALMLFEVGRCIAKGTQIVPFHHLEGQPTAFAD